MSKEYANNRKIRIFISGLAQGSSSCGSSTSSKWFFATLTQNNLNRFHGSISLDEFVAGGSTFEIHYNVVIVNLVRSSAYQVRIRQLAIKYKSPLWSNWSPFLTVPAGKLIIKWFRESFTLKLVTYSVTDTHSSHGCPCKRKKSHTSRNSNHHTLHVSYSAVNITVVARNEAGKSPETVLHVPAASAADLKSRSQSMKNFTRYLYFEHRCHNGKPRTVKVCLFYLKEGAPNKEPQYDKTVPKTHSVSLSWKEISYEHHRGFLTHYKSLCSTLHPLLIGSECFTISASMTEHHLENLTPGAKYNITLAGATRAGEGLLAAQIIETLQEKSVILDFIPHHPEKEVSNCIYLLIIWDLLVFVLKIQLLKHL
uniref:Fibronectin type-III domain-containing protein n=1 Tax=Nothobranchius furzeri TaxID=105023 RepID=A0A8C6MER3_NOTFU